MKNFPKVPEHPSQKAINKISSRLSEAKRGKESPAMGWVWVRYQDELTSISKTMGPHGELGDDQFKVNKTSM